MHLYYMYWYYHSNNYQQTPRGLACARCSARRRRHPHEVVKAKLVKAYLVKAP